MDVLILAGCSGSGKTHLANGLSEDLDTSVVLSADKYMVDKNGNYAWDGRRIPECHNKCLQEFTEIITSGLYTDHTGGTFRVQTLIVDNTNTKLQDLSPYANLALAFGHQLRVVALRCDPEGAWRRNRHDTPLRYVVRQARGLDKVIDRAPVGWNLEVLPIGKNL